MADSTLIRGFSFGDVVGGAFGVFFRNFLMFVLIAAIVNAPLLLYVHYASPPTTQNAALAQGVLVFVIQLVCSALTAAMLVYSTAQTLRGRPRNVGATISNGFAVLFPAIGVSLVFGIGVALAALAAGVPAFVTGSPWLLVIPVVVALIVVTRWWVAVPAVVIEREGVFAAIGRSSELTKGSRWTVFGIILVFGVISWLVNFVVLKTVGPGYAQPADTTTFLIVDWVATAILSALSSALGGVAYFALRVDKEGLDIDQVASVFD
ncbi:MAG: glycerophosphoryl diester phosphodiesterase membrane domain-containing protein [Alphaproteobacteria bacterium]